MNGRGYNNLYTQDLNQNEEKYYEYHSYQQYNHRPLEDNKLSIIKDTLNRFMQTYVMNMQITHERISNMTCQMTHTVKQLTGA